MRVLVFQFRYINLVIVETPVWFSRPSLALSEGQLDVSWLEELRLLLVRPWPGPGRRVVNVASRQAQLLQLLLAQLLSLRLLRGLDVHLDLYGDVGQRLLVLLWLGTVES